MIVLLGGEVAGSVERLGARPARRRVGHGENATEPDPALGDVTTRVPEQPRRCRQAEGSRRIADEEPFEARTQVLVIGLEPFEPHWLISAFETGLGLLGERAVEACMAVAQSAGLAAERESLAGELANRLEHRVARLTRR